METLLCKYSSQEIFNEIMERMLVMDSHSSFSNLEDGLNWLKSLPEEIQLLFLNFVRTKLGKLELTTFEVEKCWNL